MSGPQNPNAPIFYGIEFTLCDYFQGERTLHVLDNRLGLNHSQPLQVDSALKYLLITVKLDTVLVQSSRDPFKFTASSRLPASPSPGASNYTYVAPANTLYFYSHFGSDTGAVAAEIFIDDDIYSRYSAPALDEREEFRGTEFAAGPGAFGRRLLRVRNLLSGIEVEQKVRLDTSVRAWEIMIARDTVVLIRR